MLLKTLAKQVALGSMLSKKAIKLVEVSVDRAPPPTVFIALVDQTHANCQGMLVLAISYENTALNYGYPLERPSRESRGRSLYVEVSVGVPLQEPAD